MKTKFKPRSVKTFLVLISSSISLCFLTACGTMSHTPVPLGQAITQTAVELAKAAAALEHPEIMAQKMELTQDELSWLRIVRRSYDAGDVEVVYAITQVEKGNVSVAYPPANLGFGFGVERSRANTVTVKFPRRN